MSRAATRLWKPARRSLSAALAKCKTDAKRDELLADFLATVLFDLAWLVGLDRMAKVLGLFAAQMRELDAKLPDGVPRPACGGSGDEP